MSNAVLRLCGYTAASTEVASPNSNVKLLSLLALSASTVALPQTGEGAIIYSGTLNQHVGTDFNHSYQLSLPGTVDLQLWHTTSVGASMTLRRVSFGQKNGYARVMRGTGGSTLMLANAGPKWADLGGFASAQGLVGLVYAGGPAITTPFTDKYVAFTFKDSTAGDALRYGWANMSADLSGGKVDVTLISWGYDNTGAQIAMGDVGAVPEPVSEAMAVMGALALGAAGVRRWRAHKKAVCPRC